MAIQEPDDIEELKEFMGAEEPIDIEPMDTSFPECVLVDHIPKVDEVKKPKLINVLNKIFSQIGTIMKLEMPMKSGVSLGFALIQFQTKESANIAIENVNGYQLDKNHIFSVMPYSELSRLASLSDTYVEPPKREFQEPPDLKSWLSDESGRDQFVIRHGASNVEETTVSWSELGRTPEVHYAGEREKASGLTWCELNVQWSPKGSYLGTFHRRGVALWGGDKMQKLGRFAHDDVNRMSFSPCERYMLTCNYRSPRDGPATVLFWNIEQGKVLRKFNLTFSPPLTENDLPQPNLFKWSHDGSYVAHMTSTSESTSPTDLKKNDLIKIYSLPKLTLLDSKSLRTNGVVDFAWSPSDNTIAYWAAEEGNTPARVSLISIPSRIELRQKNLFSVTSCSMVWHPLGDFLSVKVVRHTKSKKTHFNNLELFRIREELVPVETMDVKNQITEINWEPNGTRFSMVTSEGNKSSISFYDMGGKSETGKSEMVLLKTLPSRSVSTVIWSPNGQHCVLAGLPTATVSDFGGGFEFYDVDALPERGTEVDHYRANNLKWDPSGRMVCTCVTQPLEGMVYKFQMDNGYKLWTFQGDMFYEKQWEKFYSFSWRPRPPGLLSPEQKKAVVKNLRKFERKFERADREEKRQRDLVRLLEFQKMRTEFRERVAARKARNYDALREEKMAARDGVDADAEDNYVVEEVVREVIVESKEEVIQIM
jgi:translation initiation factor 3 subunit B